MIGAAAGPVFDKANSLVDVRGARSDAERVRARLLGCRATLERSGLGAYQRDIVRRACDDVVDHASAPGRFRLRPHVVAEIDRLHDDELPRYLVYRYRYDVFPETHTVDDFPPCLQIEPSSICNYRCVFCYQTDRALTTPKNGHMGLMSLDLFKRVVDQAEGACEAVTLASRGEPLLCPDIADMLAYVRGKFLGFKINTNAWFLDERVSHAILEAGANTLVFSADAAAEPLYSTLRVRGRLERIVANIERFQRIRETQYPAARLITRVSGVRYAGTQDLDEMESFWRRLVDQVAFVDYNPWENTYQRPPSGVTAPCSDLWRRTFVWFDGTVNPCDVDYLSTLAVGNVRDASLSELWRGERYATLRATHGRGARGAVSPCDRCTLV
jgi:MoaA/NifB/PqqE/SkfB family radical SAM enzyme